MKRANSQSNFDIMKVEIRSWKDIVHAVGFYHDAQHLPLKSVWALEAASMSHDKIDANILNRTYLTICPNGF